MEIHVGNALDGDDLVPAACLAPSATPAHAAQWADDGLHIARDAGRPPTLDDLLRVVAPPDASLATKTSLSSM